MRIMFRDPNAALHFRPLGRWRPRSCQRGVALIRYLVPRYGLDRVVCNDDVNSGNQEKAKSEGHPTLLRRKCFSHGLEHEQTPMRLNTLQRSSPYGL